MDAFFVVPALVSPNVNPRLVPALCKTIERNLILSHHASFRLALLRKYGGRAVTEEGAQPSLREQVLPKREMTLREEVLHEGDPFDAFAKGVTGELTKTVIDVGGMGREAQPGSQEKDVLGAKTSTATKDAIEYPKGIVFFNQIGLEPTYLQVPVLMKQSGIRKFGTSSRVLTVGVKCVAYQLDGVSNLTALIKDMRGRSEVERWFKKKFYGVVSKIPLTIPKAIRSHGVRGGQKAPLMSKKKGPVKYDIKKDVLFAPRSEVLANPKKLQKMMNVRRASSWTTVTVFSTVDFSEMDLKENLKMYKDISKSGWGDLVIVNEAKESSHFCTSKMGACYEMPFSYMRNIMNLDNVLDYAEVSRWNKPFRMAPLRAAFREGIEVDGEVSPGAVMYEVLDFIGVDDEEELEDMDIGGEDESIESPVGRSNLSDEVEEPDEEDYKSGASKVVRDMDGEEDGSWHDPFDPGTIRYPGFGDYEKEDDD